MSVRLIFHVRHYNSTEMVFPLQLLDLFPIIYN